MNKPKVAVAEYIQFLVASPAAVSGTEAARVHAGPVVAHDAYTRLLHRLEPDATTWWQEAQGLVGPAGWAGPSATAAPAAGLAFALAGNFGCLLPGFAHLASAPNRPAPRNNGQRNVLCVPLRS